MCYFWGAEPGAHFVFGFALCAPGQNPTALSPALLWTLNLPPFVFALPLSWFFALQFQFALLRIYKYISKSLKPSLSLTILLSFPPSLSPLLLSLSLSPRLSPCVSALLRIFPSRPLCLPICHSPAYLYLFHSFLPLRLPLPILHLPLYLLYPNFSPLSFPRPCLPFHVFPSVSSS